MHITGESEAIKNSDTSGRAPLAFRFLRLVRSYTSRTPIKKGRGRIFRAALSLVNDRPTDEIIQLPDGRRFFIDLTTGMQETVYFLGEYETAISTILEKLIGPGDICIDAGANFGWYTTLMSMAAGENGSVHAFEPVPSSFEILKRNKEFAQLSNNIFITNAALGDREDSVTINLFDGQPTGHASLSDKGEPTSESYECQMITLDSYLAENQIKNVALVKVDIEGAELMFLKGAESLFQQLVPPIFIMEMALKQTTGFNYLPNDILTFLNERGAYDFYRVDELDGLLDKFEVFASGDIGANVFCIPRSSSETVQAVIRHHLR